MSAEEMLRASERSATENANSGEPIVSRVTGNRGSGKTQVRLNGIKKFSAAGAIGLVTLILFILVAVVSSGNLIPAAILEQLIVATDVQYADAVESKILVFQQALENGDVPENTVTRLAANGVTVTGNSLTFNGETIAAEDFVEKVHSNTALYNAFNAATYDRAAYYYDEAAETVFKKIGTNRNNYTSSSDFDEVMDKLVGEGSSVNVNSVGLFEKTNEKGEKYEEYEKIGEDASSSNAGEFIAKVAENNLAKDSSTATMNATDALNTADTIAKEQKSSIFFMALMENISKMKAGSGNSSKINELMNFLYNETESSIQDTSSSEMVTVKGSALESPSLYAILTGTKVKEAEVKNYASDRVLKIIETSSGMGAISSEAKEGNVTSTSTKIKGTIGRFVPDLLETESADAGTLSIVEPTINKSLVENNFENIEGIYAGELLVEGAVNVGKELAKASGGTPGDAESVQEYAKLNNTILALDAEADRMNRSPFDITSKNTFLGSIVYNLGVSVYKGGLKSVVASAVKGIFPNTSADADEEYLNTFGSTCETLNTMLGAVGTVGCAEIATFDTSTLNDTFHDAGFNAFVEENTELNEGVRVIKKDSKLADFIKYNDERITPVGVMDGGILESINSGSSKLSFISSLVSIIKAWLGASDKDKNIATGKSFVNSSSNSEWETYKYAQRYVSLARATDALRQYDGDETAYINLKFFEGTENPVVAFLNDYYEEIGLNL